MSSRKGKSGDLLVRIRHQNPLPQPPFPPKMLILKSSVARLAAFDVLKQLETEREIPFFIDPDLGLPVELDRSAPSYYEGDRYKIAPVGGNLPELDEEDLELMIEPPLGPEAQAAGAISTKPKPAVTWLRRTEYSASDVLGTPKREDVKSQIAPSLKAEKRPESKEERLEAIKASFEAVTLPASQVRHPTVSMRRAQDVSFPVIPDDRIWANVYSLIRFPDNPNEKDRNVTTATEEEAFANSATKTERALLRPVVIPEEDPRVAYYLMDTEEAAVGFKRRKLEKLPVDEGESPDHQLDQEAHSFRFVRHYESMNVRELEREYVLTLDEGFAPTGAVGEGLVKPRNRGAYYVPITQLHNYKIRRPRGREDQMDYGPAALALQVEAWDRLSVRIGLDPQVMGEGYDQRKDSLQLMKP